MNISSKIEISIILPAYNEAFRLANNVAKIEETIAAITPYFEIIIVNDGSNDQTYLLATGLIKKNIFVISYPNNQGKGHAVKQGMLKAQGKYHLFMDVDLATSIDSINQFYNFMKQYPVDILIGDRKTEPSKQKNKQPFLRRILGQCFIWLSQMILNCPIQDFNCGFKMFTAESSQTIFSRQLINRWVFDAEILFIAKKNNFKIRTLPVVWSHQESSKVRLVKDIFTSFLELLQIRYNNWQGLYKCK